VSFLSRRTNDHHSVDFTTIVGRVWSLLNNELKVSQISFATLTKMYTDEDADKVFGFFVGT